MNRGFSLVETVLSMLILGIALLAIALVPVATTKLMVSSAENERASLIATRKFEELEAEVSSSDLSTNIKPGNWSIDGLTLSWDISARAGQKQTVTMTVSWPGVAGQKQRVFTREVSTFAAPRAQ